MPQGVYNPPPSEPMDPVAALTAAGNAAGNHVDPGTVVGAVKSSQSIGEAVTNIQAIAHTGNTVKLYDTMQGMDHSQQASAWQAMSPGEQAGLRSVGYTPPNLDALSHIGAGGQHGGFWSDIGQIAGQLGQDLMPFGMIKNAQNLGREGGSAQLTRVAHDLNPGQVPGRVINDALSVAGSPLRAVQHLNRAGHAIAEQGIANQEGWQTAAKDAQGGGANVTDTAQYSLLGSPSAWSKAWDETTNGNTTIDPAIHRQLTDKYGPDQVRLANQVSAEGADAVVQSTAPAQQQAVQAQVNDPHFQDLVKQITASRMSPGRAVVGTQFILQHPEAAKVISGSIDAAIDIASDPTMHIGRAAEAAQVARYGLKDASSAQAIIQNSKGVDMYAKRIEPLLQQGRYGELGKVDPRLDAIAPQLARQNVDSAQKFKDFLASEAGMKAILSGDAAKLSHGTAIIPHLSYLGWSKSVVKDGLSASMDRLSDGKASTLFSEPTPLSGDEVMGEGEPIHLDTHSGRVANAVNLLERGQIYGDVGKIPGVSNVARLVRNTITDIPDRNYILNAPQGLADADVKNFRRWVGGVLPAAMADDLTNIFTSADEPQRRLLVTAMNKQVLHATGVYNIPDNAEAADRMMQELDNLTRDQAYSVNGNDVLVNDNGLVSHHALGDGQTAPAMTIVLPHQARALVRAHSMLSVLGVNPLNGVDRMMGMWRSMILDRPGFAVRMALDENVNRILRLGPKNFLASAVAGGAARATSDSEIAKQVEAEVKAGLIKPEDAATRESSLKAMDVKPILPYHPVERALSLLADRVPPALRPHMKTISDFYGGVLGAGARRWARKAEKGAIKAFGMQDYVNGATHYLEHQDPTGESMQDVLTGGMGGEGPIWTTQAQYRAAQKGGKASIAQFSKSAPYSEASPSDELFRFKWQVGLDTIAHSKLMRAVLETIHQDPTEQRNAVLGVLNDPSFAEEKSKFVWSKRLQDGRHVNVDATQEEADRSWAEQIVRHVNDHVRTGVSSGEGPVIQNIVDHMLSKGQAPDQEMLDEVAQRDLPQHVYGPDVVEIHPFSNFLHRSFEEMVGKPMNWMARQPHFIHQYTDALKQIRPFTDSFIPDKEGLRAEEMLLNRIHGGTHYFPGDNTEDPLRPGGLHFSVGKMANDDAQALGDNRHYGSYYGANRGVKTLRITKDEMKAMHSNVASPAALEKLNPDLYDQLHKVERGWYNGTYREKAAYEDFVRPLLLKRGLIKETHEDGSRMATPGTQSVRELLGADEARKAGYKAIHSEGKTADEEEFVALHPDAIRHLRTFANPSYRVPEEVMFEDELPAGVPKSWDEEFSNLEMTSVPPEVTAAMREKLASDLATHRALNAMTPFIHNPELRTQFEDVHRNLFPFLFAQRQFLQRWGRTFADSPSSIRELQLTMNGLRTSGVIRRDQNGNDYFYYPGAQYVTEMLTHTLNRLGVHATIPFSPSFTGQTKYLIPGLSNPTTPSVGPFAAVSINELAKLDPATQGFDTAMLQQGAGESAWRQFLPSIATRVYDAMSPAEANNMKASTTMQAMKYLDYSGHGLPNNPTNAQVESYIARLNNWSTQILLVRAALGFVLPATPGAQLDPKGLATRLHQLMDEMPYDKALAEFIKENPDGQAYTVSESKGVTSGNIPATSQVEAFTNQHAQFARSYPSAFPWIAPRSPGKFDLIAFQQQISDGERLPKVLYDPTPGHSSFVTDIIDARSSSTYYSSVDNYEAAYNQADPQTRTALTQQWDQWKAGFFQRNPVFAQYIASQAGHQDRIATIQSMEQALKDPKVPDSPAVPELKDLMQSYNNYLDTYNGPNMSYSQKTSLKAQFIQYGTDQAKQNPEIADFWNSIIRPEADSKAG